MSILIDLLWRGRDQIISGPHQHFITIRMTNSPPTVTNRLRVSPLAVLPEGLISVHRLFALVLRLSETSQTRIAAVWRSSPSVTRQLVRCVTAYTLLTWPARADSVFPFILNCDLCDHMASAVAVRPGMPGWSHRDAGRIQRHVRPLQYLRPTYHCLSYRICAVQGELSSPEAPFERPKAWRGRSY